MLALFCVLLTPNQTAELVATSTVKAPKEAEFRFPAQAIEIMGAPNTGEAFDDWFSSCVQVAGSAAGLCMLAPANMLPAESAATTP